MNDAKLERAQFVAIALVCLTAALIAAFVLTHKRTRLAETNSVRPVEDVAHVTRNQPVCVLGIPIMADSAGVEVWTNTPRRDGTLRVSVFGGGGQLLRRAQVRPLGGSARARFASVESDRGAGRVCFASDERIDLFGRSGGEGGEAVALRILRPGKENLIAIARLVSQRAALFRPGWVGPWTYYALALLALVLIALAAVLLVRYGRQPPRVWVGALCVFIVAAGNAAIWGLVMPGFTPPDEAAHYAYVESIAQEGKLPATTPVNSPNPLSEQLNLAYSQTGQGVNLNLHGKPPWTRADEQQWELEDRQLGPNAAKHAAGYTQASSYSPFYYALESLPYLSAKHSSVFTRLWLMRLLSALMVGVTAMLAFLFVRELVPNVAWLAPVAGLAVAFQPMLGFIGGAVNNDNLLILFASLELYLLARALRRGLTGRLSLAIGATLALGIAAKPGMLAFAPVVVATLAWVLWQQRPGVRKSAEYAGLAAGSCLLLLALRYGLFAGGSSSESAASSLGGNYRLPGLLSYIWEWYLPRLPFMTQWYPAPQVYDNFFRGFWANFGSLDTQFQPAVYRVLLVVSVGSIVLTGIAFWRERERVRSWLPGVLLGAMAVVCTALVVNVKSYQAFVDTHGAPFAQGRYLLPVVVVFGASVAAAALAFGRKRGIVAGTIFVLAIAFLNFFSYGLALTRYYT